MSRKRTSAECGNAVAGSSGSVGQPKEGSAKRKKVASLNDSTLHDLPMELIECILVKVVAMEVQAMKLSKCVWREKVDLVVNRLRTVCSQWCDILMTKFFRNEVHRALDATAEKTVCLEILRQRQIKLSVIELTTMNDELFMLFRLHDEKHSHAINVYGYNMAMVKDVIPLSEICPSQMAACSVSNCVYLLYVEANAGLSVQRVAKEKRQFKVSPLIKNPRLPTFDVVPMSLSPNGNLIILSRQHSPKPTVVGVYDANGAVQNKIRLSPATYGFRYVGRVIQKSDGNLVLDFTNDQHEKILLEIDLTGRRIREYRSPFNSGGICCLADIGGGRILIKYAQHKFELLDAEFNLLDIKIPPLGKGQVIPYSMQYNRERHEMVGTEYNWSTGSNVLLVYRFREE